MSCTKRPPRISPVQQTERIPEYVLMLLVLLLLLLLLFSQGPNRATFICPICHLANLDCAGLRDHCNTNHSSIKSRVVSIIY